MGTVHTGYQLWSGLTREMGNYVAACCQPADRKETDKLSISSEGSSEQIKHSIAENIKHSSDINSNMTPTVAQFDIESSSSEEEEETEHDNLKQSVNMSEEDESNEDQKNKDESSVMVKNSSFSPAENEASDKDNEEVNEPVTQIEM